MRLTEIKPVFNKYMPFEFEVEEGCLYVSMEYKTAMHLCACGCRQKVVTPIGDDGWQLTNNDDIVTLRPSIGNWAGQKTYHAHYFITNNKIAHL